MLSACMYAAFHTCESPGTIEKVADKLSGLFLRSAAKLTPAVYLELDLFLESVGFGC